jgi:hypothetical protein
MKAEFGGKLIIAGGNAKTVKGDGSGYLTAIMYLRPWRNTIGGRSLNVCANAELAQCHVGCLNTAGRGKQNNVQNWRMGKTERFWNEREAFMQDLRNDLRLFQNKCRKLDLQPCVRLNGTSDIRWENIPVDGKTVFEWFPDIQFYDYTKIANRKTDSIPNYNLTFSYSAASEAYLRQVAIARDRGMNIAVVFRKRDHVPTEFLGLPVVDGDRDDLRFLDPKQSVVALYAKGRAKQDQTGFVVDIK